MAKTDFKNIDEYIKTFPKDTQLVLEKIRTTILKAVPQAEEVISYQLPAFKYHGFLIYFSAFTNHFSLSFPPPWTVFEKHKKELSKYKMSKSTIQLPKSQPIPYELIEKMVKFRAKENKENKSETTRKN